MKIQGKVCFLCCSICLLLNFSIFAQPQPGEKLPDVEIKNLLNSKTSLIRLSDFKGKLIIMNFWSFNCVNCIEEFPKLEALQKKFAKNIQILLVNQEDKKKTVEFFEKRKKMFRRPDLIFITGDKLLSKMFPKDYLPWEIWIDQDQKYLFATDGNDLTDKTIANFITNGTYSGKKLMAHTDYDKRKPLFEQTNKEYLKLIQFISYISKYEEGINLFGNGFYLYQPGKMRLVKGATNSIEELLIAAFGEDNSLYDFELNNVSLEVSDTFKFRRPGDSGGNMDQWIANFSYNYDCILPESNAKQAYEIMRQDLINFFNVKVSIEKRKAKSLALVKIGNEDKLASRGFNTKLAMDTFYTRYNYSFQDFVGDLKVIFRNFSIPYSLLNETGYKNNIDIIGLNTASLKDRNLLAFRDELHKYGLDLIEKEYLQDVLVIKDK